MREIVLDTETTGLSPTDGHRVIEIGCIELRNLVPTGQQRWWYLNPDRDIPPEAQAVHGITAEMLADKPRFREIAKDLLEFLGDSPLVAHNAGFDLKFLNAELTRAGYQPIARDRAVDTVEIARRKFPGAQASLDALCKRFAIDLSRRNLHGALLDAQLLAEVYLQLRGGRQSGLGFELQGAAAPRNGGSGRGDRRAPRLHTPSAEESAAHAAMVAGLKGALWALGKATD